MMLSKIPTIIAALSVFSNVVTAKVSWLVNYDINKPTLSARCAELRIVDEAINFGALTIADWVCNAREIFPGSKTILFDFGGKYPGYRATIRQNDINPFGGFTIIYTTDHGVFSWSTGTMNAPRQGTGIFYKEGTALG